MKKGYTLLEAILAMAILVILMMTAAPFLRTTQISWEKDKKLSNILQNARMALDRISYELRHTNEIIEIDANYVKFATYLEEAYFDDRNAGHTQTGTWISGTSQGGYGGDYLISNTPLSTSRWEFNIICEGEYDIYIWYISTSSNSPAVGYSVFDDNFNEANYTVNQQINGSRWYRLGTVNFTNGGMDYLQMTVPAANYAVADGVKLVYKGYDHKEFNFVKQDPTPLPYDESHKIFFRAASKTNAEAYLLIGNVYRINEDKPGEIPIFQYFQMDAVTPATTPKDVALIRIAFEVRDPDNKVPPYQLSTQVRRMVSPAERRLVINEINYSPPKRPLAFDRFDGLTGGMDGKCYGWSTALADGWESFYDDLEHAQDPDGGTWIYNWGGSGNYNVTNVLDGTDRVISYAGTVSGNQDVNSRLWIIERSQNYTWRANFRVLVTGGNNLDPQFGFYLRYIDANNYVKVDTYMSGPFQQLRVRIVDAGTVKWNTSVTIPALGTGWHTIRIDDTWGRIRVMLDDTVHFSGIEYNTNNNPPNTNNNICNVPLGQKALFVWSNNTVYFDDIVITSYDFRPVALTSNFEAPIDTGTCSNTYQNNAQQTGGWHSGNFRGACAANTDWRRGIPTAGPGFDRTPYGPGYAWATVLGGNYSNSQSLSLSYTGTGLDSEPAHICLSTLPNDTPDVGNINNIWIFSSGISIKWWAYIDVPNPDDGDALVLTWDDDNNTTDNTNLWNEFAIYPITAGAGYNPNPWAYDGTRNAVWEEGWGAGTIRSWRSVDHIPVGMWANLRAAILPTQYRRHLRPLFRWQVNATTNAYGVAIDDVEVAPGGIWQRGVISGPKPANLVSYSDPNVWGTRLDNPYCNYANAAIETPVIDLSPTGADLTADDFLIVSFMLYTHLEGTSGNPGTFYDGGILEISNDSANNWQNWTQITNAQISSRETSDNSVYDYEGTIVTSFCNELGGLQGWVVNASAQGWRRIYIRLGNTYNGQKIKLRFRFGSDDSYPEYGADNEHGQYTGTLYRGFFIDNFEVYVLPDPRLEYIELYNPTPYSIDVNNWRIETNSHIGSPDANGYDTISANGCGTIIGPYGYAIITNINTNTYVYRLNDRWCYGGEVEPCVNNPPGEMWQPACSTLAVRLQIDDNYFGHDGLTDDYGYVKLMDSSGRLIDYVLYNAVFFDNMERRDAGYPFNVWSRSEYATGDTRFTVADPVSASGPPNNFDRTCGQYGSQGCRCWLLQEQNPLTNEDYDASARANIITPAIDLTGTSVSNPAIFEYWQFVDTENNNNDGGLLQVSISGGANFTETDPFTDIVTNAIISPSYDGVINGTGNVLNTYWGYWADSGVTGWKRVEVDLTGYAGRIIMIRFYFGADSDTVVGTGWYIDDVACYFNWGGKGNSRSLQRRNWAADSSSWQNWGDSPLWGTPAAVNTW